MSVLAALLVVNSWSLGFWYHTSGKLYSDIAENKTQTVEFRKTFMSRFDEYPHGEMKNDMRDMLEQLRIGQAVSERERQQARMNGFTP